MRIVLCNEVIAGPDFVRQCALAAKLGYDGLELAPFTLADDPATLGAREGAALQAAARQEGLEIASLHWLLVKPAGLSITSRDPAVQRRTLDMIRRLVDFAAALGARVLVHGSPAQRAVGPHQTPEDALTRATAAWAVAAEAARAARLIYCLEPLPRDQTPLVNTLAEAAAVIARIGNPALRTMLDTRAAALSEAEPVPALLERWWPSGLIAHVQVNDRSNRAPGQGGDRFAPLLAALARVGYDGALAVEPFVYEPDGPTAAARAIGYLRGILEAQAGR